MARVGVVGVVLALLLVADASAATRTWDGGCGAETAWSCAANWSENTVPGAEDTAVFDGTSANNSSVDASFAGTVAGVSVNIGYTGTISLGRSLAVSGIFLQGAGTFTAGSQTLSVKTLTLNNGSFTASSGTTHVSGTLKIAATSTFSANGGTMDFNGAASATLSCGSKTFNLVTFTHTAGTKAVGANCILPLGKGPKVGSGGSLNLNGTLAGEGPLMSTGTLTLGAAGVLSGFSGLSARNLKIVKGSYNFGAYEPFAVSAAFTLGLGSVFTAPSGTASFGGNFTIKSGATFNAGEGTVNFNGKTSFKMSCGGQAFNAVTIESTGHKTIASDCTLPLGEDPSLGKGGTTLNGTLSGSGTLTQTGTFEIGTATPGLASFADIVDSGAFLVASEATVEIASGGTLTVQGNFTVNAGAAFDAIKGTVNFQALPKTTKTITCNEAEFGLVTFTNTSKEVVGSDCSLPLGGNPEIGEGGQIVLNGELTGSGALTANSLLLTLGSTGSLSGFSGLSSDALLVEGAHDFSTYESFAANGDFTIAAAGEFSAPEETTASFAGDFANAGTFNADKGTVELIGTGQAISGSTTFEDLTKTVASADTLTFAAGSTQTVEGALTLEGGSAEELLSLVSSAPETAWRLAGEGPRSAKWLSVADSENTGTAISALESSNAGGNTGWSFP